MNNKLIFKEQGKLEQVFDKIPLKAFYFVADFKTNVLECFDEDVETVKEHLKTIENLHETKDYDFIKV